VSSRYGLSIRTANSGDVDGLAELLKTSGWTIGRDALSARLSAIHDQPGALLIAEEWGRRRGSSWCIGTRFLPRTSSRDGSRPCWSIRTDGAMGLHGYF
jgi:hypothetical protein